MLTVLFFLKQLSIQYIHSLNALLHFIGKCIRVLLFTLIYVLIILPLHFFVRKDKTARFYQDIDISIDFTKMW